LYEQPNACLENHDFVRKKILSMDVENILVINVILQIKRTEKYQRFSLIELLLKVIISVNSRNNNNKEVHNSMYKDDEMFI